jgi:hypothetical protein
VIIFFSSYRRRNGKDQERDLYQEKKDGARTPKGPSRTQPQQNFLKNGGMQEGHAGLLLLLLLLQPLGVTPLFLA